MRFVFKKNSRPSGNEKRPEAKQQLIDEIAFVAQKLQDKTDENIRIQNENTSILATNASLKDLVVTLKETIQKLNLQIDQKRQELNDISSVISSRNNSLNTLNNIVAKLSEKYGIELETVKNKLVKAKMDEGNFNKAQHKYDNIQKEIDKLKIEHDKELEKVNTIKDGNKKVKIEAEKNRSETERLKTEQAKVLKNILFYGNRINDYYKELQIKPPIDMSKI